MIIKSCLRCGRWCLRTGRTITVQCVEGRTVIAPVCRACALVLPVRSARPVEREERRAA